MKRCALLILLGACVAQTDPVPAGGGAGGGATQVAVTAETESVIEAIPYQRWIDVPPYVIGILYEAGGQPWGGSIGHMRGFHDGPQRTEYKFSFDGTSPYALYFESDGRGFNFLTGWGVPVPGSKYEQFDAAMFDSSTENEWGLDGDAHLVELEVNNGKGGGGLHFVVTDARVLDGSDEYPMDPTEVLVALRRRFDAEVEGRRAELDARLAESKRRAEQRLTGERKPDDGSRPVGKIAVWPTWKRDERRLSVTFAYLATGAVTGTIPADQIKRPDCPPGAPCVDWGPPQPQDVSQAYGVEMGVTYEVDPAGNVTGVKIYEPYAR